MKNGPLFTMLGAAFALGVVCGLGTVSPHDDTDTRDQRSGMRPHVDALSGCQYLSVPGGGITPRLDNQGRHMCAGYLTPKPAKGLL